MLCRNAGLSKDAIGAIRVQYQETFVEIANSAVAAMKQELGATLEIEQGARLTELPGKPDFDASPKGPSGPPRDADTSPRKPKHRGEKPARGPRKSADDAKAPDAQHKPKGKPAAKPHQKFATKDEQPRHKAPKDKPKGARKDEKPRANAKPEGKPKRASAALDTSKSVSYTHLTLPTIA